MVKTSEVAERIAMRPELKRKVSLEQEKVLPQVAERIAMRPELKLDAQIVSRHAVSMWQSALR